MGLLNWLFGRLSSSARTPAVASLEGPGTYSLPVVGESHYQKHLQRICGRRKRDGEDKFTQATLVLEDSNTYDKNAVRVDINELPVGYLGADHAIQYRKLLRKAGHPRLTATCEANIRGGWDNGDGDVGRYGVWLDLPMNE
jgi:hypothetical protein